MCDFYARIHEVKIACRLLGSKGHSKEIVEFKKEKVGEWNCLS